MRPAIIIALLLFVSAAAAAPPDKRSREPQHGQCDIGVASNLGEKFTVKEHILVLGEKNTDVSVESWHLDDLVVEKVRSALGKRAVRIPYRKESLAVVETIENATAREGPLLQLIQYSGRAAKLADAIRTLAPGTRCASYMVVVESTIVDSNGIPLVGIGINKTLGLQFMHAVIEVIVYDGETFKVLSDQRGNSQRGGIQLLPTAHPKRLVDASFWPDPPASAEQNTNLRDIARELVAECLDEMLPKLSLTP
jgi:hypothetical protein